MQGIDSDLIRGHIDTIILNILAEGDRYGYEICKEVEVKSNGTYELKQPTLYSCLKRLEDKGLISSYWEDSDIGGKRHYYKLTDQGQEAFKQNQEDWLRSRRIIDSLISTESGDDKTSIPSSDTLSVDEDEKVETAGEEPDNTETGLIFDEIDKEVEEQDNGHISDDQEMQYLTNNEAEPEDAGFDKVEENDSLPFDDEDYSEYCPHLVKNDAQNDEDNLVSQAENAVSDEENQEENDDILALLGHYHQQEQSQNAEPNENDESSDDLNDTNNSDENEEKPLRQEDEFLAKFTTGKYSEYNPDAKDYASALEESTVSDAEFEEEQKTQDLVTAAEEFNDENEFGEQTFEESGNSFFNTRSNDEETAKEPEIVYDKAEENDLEQKDETEPETDSNHDNEELPNDDNTGLYSDITYFNLNKPQYDDISEAKGDNLLEGFASKYDAEIPNYLASENKDEDDEIALDFSQERPAPSFTVFDGTTPQQENDEEDNETIMPEIDEEADQSTFVEEQEDQGENLAKTKEYDNKVDLTSVYDKSSTINPYYTDVNAKEKLSSLASVSINPALLQDNAPNPLPSNTVEETAKAPQDISNLKLTFENEGIAVRPYERQVKEPTSAKTFIETNRIKMIRNWITFFIEMVLLGITMLITSGYSFNPDTFQGRYAYYLCAFGVFLIIGIFSTIRYWLNPYKKVVAKYAPRLSHLFAIIFTVQFYLIIYCINLQFGFYSFAQTNYNHLNWIVPCVACLAPIISSIVYEILYKSKNFHV
ncbi:MAG: helix-turn-helix transcriptional regulator [Clostridia bacterium]|nr:helix-turn-helix transcriptional regulator [Clostridia bacterium]